MFDLRHKDTVRSLFVSVLAVVTVILGGTAGYSVLEGWSLLDSLYMTVITLTTIGFKEVHDMDRAGMLFTLVLIIFGVGTVAVALKNAAKLMLEGELRKIFGRRKLEQKIRHLKDHYVVCGYGRMGKRICREFAKKPVPFVLVEKDTDAISEADWDRYLILQGDATTDDVLIEAGIQRARGLITVVSSDADNLYIVLSARGVNPDLYIVARAGEEGSEQKLMRAGANKVISPYLIGAERIAQAALRPAVVDFIEFATHSEHLELQIEEIGIKEGSPLAGVALNKSGLRQDYGIIIVAIKRADGTMEFNPSPSAVLRQGDYLIALGEPEKMKSIEKSRVGS